VQRHRRSRLSNSHHERHRSSKQGLLHPKKVGTLPVSDQEVKRTNEIKTAIPLLDAIDIQGKDVTADALLTQRKIADYLVRKRQAHYHFTVKNNQPGLFQDIALYFKNRTPDFVHCDAGSRRIEIRKIWNHRTQRLPEFSSRRPGFCHPTRIHRSANTPVKSPMELPAEPLNKPTRNACWLPTVDTGVENCCHYIIDWNYDEDRSRIRTGHGPENITRLRRFAISIIKGRGGQSVPQKMRQLIVRSVCFFSTRSMK
jgi:predicted transposase YbfD/YdcC